jgi:patatin-like phospholipase/acyl hydrolase
MVAKLNYMDLLERFNAPGPKRILSLDGGGIRGALTIGYLEKIEALLRERHNNEHLLLCDYFDLVGGTSTGAIIAACLAKGMSVAAVRNLYLELGGLIFRDKYCWIRFNKRIQADYKKDALLRELNKEFGNMTMGSEDWRTGLSVTLKRADTNSTWFLLNHPKGKYYPVNKNIQVWKALAASAAAPSYFLPETIHVGGGQDGCFVDGGVSVSNNPSVSLFQIASLEGFPFKWAMGEDKLLLVSIGTGYSNAGMIPSKMSKKGKLFWAKNAADFYMQDANWENQAFLQWISNSPTAVEIDSMRGKLQNDLLAGRPLLTYLRYNIEMSQNSLGNLNLGATYTTRNYDAKEIKSLMDMAKAENRELLYHIGVAASHSIQSSHFPIAFNI